MSGTNCKNGLVEIGCGGKSARLALNGLCGLLPDGIQYRCFALIKKYANLLAGRRFEDLYSAWDHLAAQKPAQGKEQSGALRLPTMLTTYSAMNSCRRC